MAEFCEMCPLRGSCSDKIANAAKGYVEFESKAVMGYGPLIAKYNGDIGALLDEYGNPSEPLYFPPNRSEEQMIQMVENCEGPVIEQRGFLRKRRYIAGCSSLGRFACNQPELKQYVKSQLR